MNIMKIFCSSCAGMGKIETWKVVDTDDNIGTIEREDAVCEACGGNGYTEYATFTLEEAKVILKHCGLSTEN